MISVEKYALQIDPDTIAPFKMGEIQRLRDSMWAEGYEWEGVLYWDNSNVIPVSVLKDAVMEIPPKQEAAEEKQLRNAIENYKARVQRRSAEELAEQMYERRAAFGEGETVVDIITGETFKT